MNPWKVQSIQDLNFLCCPECVYRFKEELTFQTHTLQNNVLLTKFFSEFTENTEEKSIKEET